MKTFCELATVPALVAVRAQSAPRESGIDRFMIPCVKDDCYDKSTERERPRT